MVNKTKLFIGGLLLTTVAAFAGCWIPEQFEAKVVVNKDGSYTFSYDGILTFALALAAARKGELSAKDEAAFKQEAAKIQKGSRKLSIWVKVDTRS